MKTMKMERNTLERMALLAVTAWLGAADRAPADTVRMRSGAAVAKAVREIRADRIVTADGTAIEVGAATGVDFDADPVPAKPDGLVLTDGTTLNGVLHAMDRSTVRFRSTSLGPLTLPLARVAALYFGAPPAAPVAAPSAGRVAVTLATGATVEGAAMTFSAESVLLRETNGLRRVRFEETAAVRLAASKPFRSGVTLRNGDRIALPIRWTGRGFEVEVDGEQRVTLTLEALKAAVF